MSSHLPDMKVAVVGKPHGIRGLVHIHANIEDPFLLEVFPYLLDKNGRKWHLQWHKKSRHLAVLTCEDGTCIENRDQARAYGRMELYVPREFFGPLKDDEYYLSDLMGLDVYEDNKQIGKVVAVHDYGAGASIELSDKRILAFTKMNIPQINIEENWLSIRPPEEVICPPQGPTT